MGKEVIPTPTAATINNPAVIAAAKINAQLAEVQARLAAVAAFFPSLADTIDPPTTTITGYDPSGDVLIHEDQNGSEIFTRYDAIGREIAVRVFRAGQHDSFAGDPIFAPAPVRIITNNGSNTAVVVGTTEQNFQYNGLSRVTFATDNNDPANPTDDSKVTDAYDSLGRVIEETQQIGTQPALAIDSAWRADGLRSSLTYPNGRVKVYTYERSAGSRPSPTRGRHNRSPCTNTSAPIACSSEITRSTARGKPSWTTPGPSTSATTEWAARSRSATSRPTVR